MAAPVLISSSSMEVRTICSLLPRIAHLCLPRDLKAGSSLLLLWVWQWVVRCISRLGSGERVRCDRSRGHYSCCSLFGCKSFPFLVAGWVVLRCYLLRFLTTRPVLPSSSDNLPLQPAPGSRLSLLTIPRCTSLHHAHPLLREHPQPFPSTRAATESF